LVYLNEAAKDPAGHGELLYVTLPFFKNNTHTTFSLLLLKNEINHE